MRLWSHTRRPLHDTIGSSSVAATGITACDAMLVTIQYGAVAIWVHAQVRPVATRPEAEPGETGRTCG